MDDGKTAPVDRPTSTGCDPRCPPGLLWFHPLDHKRMRYFALVKQRTVIGRGKDCDIVVDDAGCSRRHAALAYEAGRIRLVDENSANGVIVDGTKRADWLFNGGEVVRLGDSFFRYVHKGLTPHHCEFDVHTDGIVSGPSLDDVRRLLTGAASEAITVLITGETGTGKDLAARYLHTEGSRRQGPFVAVNCAAIPATIVDSELFGHVKGSFTGAVGDGIGLVRQADGGTLFLDEIGDLPMEIQSRLLRVLQDRQVRAVGATKSATVDVRVVCATNRDLGTLVREGQFRQDLYARIAELAVEMPPLRDRVEDIPLLTRHLLGVHGFGHMRLTASALEVLCARSWPLNVRGLESAVRRAVMLAADTDALAAEHFPADALDDWIPGGTQEAAEPLDDKALALEELLRKHAGNVELAAAEVGLSRSQLYRRAKKAGIDPSRFRL